MSGTFSIGGNTIISHSGAEGSGTVTLSNVTLGSGVAFSTFVGLILPFAYDTSGSPPFGFFECDGSAVSRTTYSNLFAVIGTTWGTGNGSTTFNIPDLRGAFLRGTGTVSMNNRNKIGPTNVGDFQEDQFQSHKHSFNMYKYFSDSNNSELVGVTGQPPMANDGASGSGVGDPKTDGTNGTPRIGAETRPYNAGVMYCIKY